MVHCSGSHSFRGCAVDVLSFDSRRVVIVGAGPAGLCLARALARLGLTVDIVDRQSEASLATPDFDGREIALSHKTIRVLGDLGIWQQIPVDEIHPLRRAHVSDGAPEGFDVDAQGYGQDRLGNLVPNDVIRAAAWRAVQDDPAIRVHAGAAVQKLEPAAGHQVVVLDDGRRLAAPLLVAADSRFSFVRRLLGVPVALHDFGKTMLVCRMHQEAPHGGVAREWFGRGQTRALLPLSEQTVSMVLTVKGQEAAALEALDDDSFAREIETRLEHRFGRMQVVGTRHAYPLVATWAKRFVGPGFALVGDAAVGMHPVTAHGFNLGLASVARLAQAIGGALARGSSPADAGALARYQRHHRAGALPIFLGTGLVVGLYTDDRRLAQPLRSAVMGGMRRVGLLREGLAATVLERPLAQAAARLRP